MKAYLYISDVIEILTNIKLKQGNLPVYVERGLSNYWIEQDDDFGIHFVQDPPSVVISIDVYK